LDQLNRDQLVQIINRAELSDDELKRLIQHNVAVEDSIHHGANMLTVAERESLLQDFTRNVTNVAGVTDMAAIVSGLSPDVNDQTKEFIDGMCGGRGKVYLHVIAGIMKGE
jgi:hypothetical protein